MTPIHASIAHLILAQTPAAPPAGPAGLLGNPLIMMGLMVVMFYFLLIRPQQRQRKEMAARIASLQAGDKVVTSAGIHGIVHNVKEHTVVVKVAEGTMLEFDKPAIATVHKKDVSAK
jgi:preprotein translocase subunit YajC